MAIFNIICIVIISAYLALCLALFGKTKSISFTLYDWIDQFGGEQSKTAIIVAKLIFSVFAIVAPFCLLLGTTVVANQIPFVLAASGLAIVGVFCLYKYVLIGILHVLGVIIAVSGVLYFCFLEDLWTIAIPCALYCSLLCYLDRENKVYWIEVTVISILFLGMSLRGYLNAI